MRGLEDFRGCHAMLRNASQFWIDSTDKSGGLYHQEIHRSEMKLSERFLLQMFIGPSNESFELVNCQQILIVGNLFFKPVDRTLPHTVTAHDHNSWHSIATFNV